MANGLSMYRTLTIDSFPSDMFTSSKLRYSISDSADKSGVKSRLKKFIIRRPSMKTLQEKGIIKGEPETPCRPSARLTHPRPPLNVPQGR